MAAFTALSLAMSLAGTAANAYGQKKAGTAAANASIAVGDAQQRASESQAGLDEYNAKVTDLQAQDAIDRGAMQEAKYRSSVRGLLGSQTASTAADNIVVNTGSAVDIHADAARLGEIDALQIRTNAAREAWGYNVQGQDLRNRAAVARKEGAAYAEAGRVQAGGIKTATNIGITNTLLGAGTSLLAAKYGFGPATSSGTGSTATPSPSIEPNHLEG